jgi:phospholipase/carboxylesterase
MHSPPQQRPDPDSRLRARPQAGTALTAPGGSTPLRLGHGRDGLLYVHAAAATAPSPLVVLLHGAGSSAPAAMVLLGDLAEAYGLVLLAPDSRGSTWDVIRGGFGPDVAFVDHALEHVFARCPIDPDRVALAGFSDGASYALSLGIGNGDLFTHLIAFSPGFAAPDASVGRPRVFLTHGTADAVLPIDRCSRRLAPALRAGGYDLVYEEFEGGHSVPAHLARRAVQWMTDP